jgi:hypothetical protein
MAAAEVDELARELALTRYALPLCLHIAIGARDEDAIERFIGRIETVLMAASARTALLVHAYDLPEVDTRLPIWKMPEAAILRHPRQIWVHVDCRQYRQAYAKAHPEQDLKGLVLDHVMNRRVARLKRFNYVRIVPISRAANSSSGGLSEKWGASTTARRKCSRRIEGSKPSFSMPTLPI